MDENNIETISKNEEIVEHSDIEITKILNELEENDNTENFDNKSENQYENIDKVQQNIQLEEKVEQSVEVDQKVEQQDKVQQNIQLEEKVEQVDQKVEQQDKVQQNIQLEEKVEQSVEVDQKVGQVDELEQTDKLEQTDEIEQAGEQVVEVEQTAKLINDIEQAVHADGYDSESEKDSSKAGDLEIENKIHTQLNKKETQDDKDIVNHKKSIIENINNQTKQSIGHNMSKLGFEDNCDTDLITSSRNPPLLLKKKKSLNLHKDIAKEVDSIEKKNNQEDRESFIEKFIVNKKKECGCCCYLISFFLVSIIYFSFFSYPPETTMYSPLSTHIQNTNCLEVYFKDKNYVQIYNNRTLHNYIESLRYHIKKEKLSGLTMYHVGLPLCVIVMKDFYGYEKIFFNPTILAYSKKKYEIQDESDILCSNMPISRRKRFINIEIEYEEINEKCLSGLETNNCSTIMRRRMEAFDSFLFQHLLDNLKGKSICND